MPYTLDQKEFTRLKGRLTRVENKGDSAKIIAECDYAFKIFDEKGYPDSWHHWNIAREDAKLRTLYQ